MKYKPVFYFLLVIALVFTSGCDPTIGQFEWIIDLAATDSSQEYTPLGISAAVYRPADSNSTPPVELLDWYGVAGPQEVNGTTVTDDMVFGIGSITKTFVAALVLTYCEDEANLLDLNDTIGETPVGGCDTPVEGINYWFKKTELPDEAIIPPDITIEELLFQRSGLRDWTPINQSNPTPEMIGHFSDLLTNQYGPADLILNHDANASTLDDGSINKEFAYCNLNYVILGRILEKVIGTNSSVAQEIYSLLGDKSVTLPDTYMTYPTFPSDRQLVLGHVWIGIPGLTPFEWRNENDAFIQALFPGITDERIVQLANYAGSMVSTAQDLAKWAVALYKDTGNGGSQILSPTNRALMLQGLGTDEYGAGTFLYDTNLVGHGGSNYIYRGLMQYDIDNDEAIVVLMNKDNAFGGTLISREEIVEDLREVLHPQD